jgi:hypothetical protein
MGNLGLLSWTFAVYLLPGTDRGRADAMRSANVLLPGMVALVLLAGCADSRWQLGPWARPPLTAVQRVALIEAAKCSGGNFFGLDNPSPQEIANSPWARDLLVELDRLGARLDPDGTLRDGKGKEIRFWAWPHGPGCQMLPEGLEALHKANQLRFDELRAQYTVLVVPNERPYPP